MPVSISEHKFKDSYEGVLKFKLIVICSPLLGIHVGLNLQLTLVSALTDPDWVIGHDGRNPGGKRQF
jgi:hypothetical protein